MQKIKLGETSAALKRIRFTAVDVNNLQTRLDASLLTIAIRLLKPDNTSVAGGGAITQVDGTNARGSCVYTPSAAELDQLGSYEAIFSASGMEQFETEFDVVSEDPHAPAYYGTVVAGTLSTSQFSTDRTESTTDVWKNNRVEFLTGPCTGNSVPIGGFNSSTKVITVKSGYTLPAVPVAGNIFRIVSR